MKRSLQIVLVLVVALTACAALTMRPIAPRVRIVTANGYVYRCERERRWEVVPLRDAGLGPETLNGCGPNGGVTERSIKFGILSYVDSSSVSFCPVKRRPVNSKATGTTRPNRRQADLSRTDAAVLSAVLSVYSDQPLIVSNRTLSWPNSYSDNLKDARRMIEVPGEDHDRIREMIFRLQEIPQEALRDYNFRNRKEGRLPLGLPSRRWRVVGLRERTGDWKTIRQRFPDWNGITSLSFPGYDRSGKVAIVLLKNVSGPRAGHVFLYKVERGSQVWAVRWDVWLGSY